VFGVVVNPGQWVPVLFFDDVRSVLLSAAALAAGSLMACSGTAREVRRRGKTPSVGLVRGPAIAAIAIPAGSTVYYKALGGIGLPTWRLILTPLACIVAAAIGGLLGSWLHRAPWFLTGPLSFVLAVAVASGIVVTAGELDRGSVARSMRNHRSVA